MKFALLSALIFSFTTNVLACSLVGPIPYKLADQMAGVTEAFGGTVIGFVAGDGKGVLGAPPRSCLDQGGKFRWWDWKRLPPKCEPFLDVTGALFRVDTAVVGSTAGEVRSVYMTWGDGDCNTDYNFGEQWLIAGAWLQEELNAPITDEEVKKLRRLALRTAR